MWQSAIYCQRRSQPLGLLQVGAERERMNDPDVDKRGLRVDQRMLRQQRGTSHAFGFEAPRLGCLP